MNTIILIVDDNMDFIVNLQLTLEFNDFQVLSAENGKEAIKVLKEHRELPNLIISDILMPEMNGYEFFTAISKNPKWKNIPFLFLTGYSPIEEELKSEKIIEDDILIKPYKEDELLQIIYEKIV